VIEQGDEEEEENDKGWKRRMGRFTLVFMS
jgi:hypothetical protein